MDMEQAKALVELLQAAGFEDSNYYDNDGRFYVDVRCSSCNARIKRRAYRHEHGCPNARNE